MNNAVVRYKFRPLLVLSLTAKLIRSFILQPNLPLDESCFYEGLVMIFLAHALKAKPNYSATKDQQCNRSSTFFEDGTFKVTMLNVSLILQHIL